jgi:hypothetical protein
MFYFNRHKREADSEWLQVSEESLMLDHAFLSNKFNELEDLIEKAEDESIVGESSRLHENRVCEFILLFFVILLMTMEIFLVFF